MVRRPKLVAMTGILRMFSMHKSIVAGLLCFALSIPLAEIAFATTGLDGEPCVTLGFHAAAGRSARDGRTQGVEVVAHLQDGRTLTGVFPYDWIYENPARDNPFYRANAFQDGKPFAVQLPKKRLEKKAISPVIAYVLEHTDASGRLHANSCAPPTAPPATTLHERINARKLVRHLRNMTHQPLYITSEFVSKGDGPVKVCLLALNIGTQKIDRLELRFDFTLNSGVVVATPYEWLAALEPTTAERDQWQDIIVSMAFADRKACVPITEDPRLRANVDAISTIDITIVGIHAAI